MRRLDSLRLAVIGLALAAPAVAWAGPPAEIVNSTAKHRRGRHLCPDCQLKEQMRKDGLTVPPPTTVAGMPMASNDLANCTACQAGGTVVMAPGTSSGYAAVGGMVTAEPTPVGVVQTNYRATPTGGAPGYASVGGMNHAAAVPPAGIPVGDPPRGRAHVLAHLFGLPTRGDWTQESRARKRAAHAAIRYDDGVQKVTDLPASMVFGRSH